MMLVETLSSLAKDNPLSVIGGMIAAAIIGAITIDDRYAHAGDLGKVNQSVAVSSLKSEVAILELRRSSLADKVYELDVKKVSPETQALRARYSADLVQVTAEQATKKKLIDELETGAKK